MNDLSKNNSCSEKPCKSRTIMDWDRSGRNCDVHWQQKIKSDGNICVIKFNVIQSFKLYFNKEKIKRIKNYYASLVPYWQNCFWRSMVFDKFQ